MIEMIDMMYCKYFNEKSPPENHTYTHTHIYTQKMIMKLRYKERKADVIAPKWVIEMHSMGIFIFIIRIIIFILLGGLVDWLDSTRNDNDNMKIITHINLMICWTLLFLFRFVSIYCIFLRWPDIGRGVKAITAKHNRN